MKEARAPEESSNLYGRAIRGGPMDLAISKSSCPFDLTSLCLFLEKRRENHYAEPQRRHEGAEEAEAKDAEAAQRKPKKRQDKIKRVRTAGRDVLFSF